MKPIRSSDFSRWPGTLVLFHTGMKEIQENNEDFSPGMIGANIDYRFPARQPGGVGKMS